jgi:hypothetical protein
MQFGAIHNEPCRYGDQDEKYARERDCGRALESLGDYCGESRDDKHQDEQDEPGKYLARSGSDQFTGDVLDGFSAETDGDHKRKVVVHRAYENVAEQYP